ncbi:MAG: cyclic nucleotide-binding domain-containing protein [Polyangiaceae bacterium]
MPSGFHLVPLALGKRVDDLETLGRNPLLARLTPHELEVLVEHMDHVDVPAGNLPRENDSARCMYFLLEGSARIHRNQLELRPLLPGDHFESSRWRRQRSSAPRSMP